VTSRGNLVFEDGGSRIEDGGLRIEDRELFSKSRDIAGVRGGAAPNWMALLGERYPSILDPPSSILDLQGAAD
jgi:hypothetical protein